MGIFSLFSQPNFNELLETYKKTEGAYLIDVREDYEFKEGHVPNAKNIPLGIITLKINEYVKDLNAPIYVYCLSGSRSAQAASALKRLGYTNVTNLGGINAYKGSIQR